jgi:hypothetical protein
VYDCVKVDDEVKSPGIESLAGEARFGKYNLVVAWDFSSSYFLSLCS